uniref:RING-type domain-containing protein n=1 Tax=Steinernema glaseri TaxID=37863 RepID=A0A1I7YRS4_9BILA
MVTTSITAFVTTTLPGENRLLLRNSEVKQLDERDGQSALLAGALPYAVYRPAALSCPTYRSPNNLLSHLSRLVGTAARPKCNALIGIITVGAASNSHGHRLRRLSGHGASKKCTESSLERLRFLRRLRFDAIFTTPTDGGRFATGTCLLLVFRCCSRFITTVAFVTLLLSAHRQSPFFALDPSPTAIHHHVLRLELRRRTEQKAFFSISGRCGGGDGADKLMTQVAAVAALRGSPSLVRRGRTTPRFRAKNLLLAAAAATDSRHQKAAREPVTREGEGHRPPPPPSPRAANPERPRQTTSRSHLPRSVERTMLAGFLDRVRKRFNSDDLPPSRSRSSSLSSASSCSSSALSSHDDPSAIPSTSAAAPSAGSPFTVRLFKSPSRPSSRSSKHDRSSSKRRHTAPLEMMIEPAMIERFLAKRHIQRLYVACEKEEPDLPELSIDECFLCRSRKATICVLPCMHEIMCRKCAVHLVEISLNKGLTGVNCPICRTEVTHFINRKKRSASAAPLRKNRSSTEASRSVAASSSGTRSRIYCSSSASSSSST